MDHAEEHERSEGIATLEKREDVKGHLISETKQCVATPDTYPSVQPTDYQASAPIVPQYSYRSTECRIPQGLLITSNDSFPII